MVLRESDFFIYELPSFKITPPKSSEYMPIGIRRGFDLSWYIIFLFFFMDGKTTHIGEGTKLIRHKRLMINCVREHIANKWLEDTSKDINSLIFETLDKKFFFFFFFLFERRISEYALIHFSKTETIKF